RPATTGSRAAASCRISSLEAARRLPCAAMISTRDIPSPPWPPLPARAPKRPCPAISKELQRLAVQIPLLPGKVGSEIFHILLGQPRNNSGHDRVLAGPGFVGLQRLDHVVGMLAGDARELRIAAVAIGIVAGDAGRRELLAAFRVAPVERVRLDGNQADPEDHCGGQYLSHAHPPGLLLRLRKECRDILDVL